MNETEIAQEVIALLENIKFALAVLTGMAGFIVGELLVLCFVCGTIVGNGRTTTGG